jgi:hypothetical protein
MRKKTRELHVPDFENKANAVVDAHIKGYRNKW